MINDEQIKQILTIATHAISPYNSQPWRFKLTDKGVDIFILRSKNFFLKLEGILEFTLGSLLENLAEGAKHMGFSAHWDEIKPIQDLDQPCVSVIFSQYEKESHNIDHVLTRRTTRVAYSKNPITTEHQQLLQDLFDNKNIEVTFLERRDKDYMAEIIETLEFTRLSVTKLIDEMLGYFRVDDQDVSANKNLLDLNNFGLSKTIVQIIKRVKSNKLLYSFYRLTGGAKKASRQTRELLDNSGTILTFSLAKHDYQSLVETGQIIQRLLNEMHKLGIASMSLGVLYLFDILDENPEIFNNQQKDAILNCKWDMEALVNKNKYRQKISFIIRAGYYLEQTPQAAIQRKFIDDLLL